MKKMMISLACFLIATHAMGAANSANVMICQEELYIADAGYMAEISADQSTLQIQTQTIAGPITVANLVCGDEEAPELGTADVPSTIYCYEPHIADAGYAAVIVKGGFSGTTMVQLSEVSFMGSQAVATLLCKASK